MPLGYAPPPANQRPGIITAIGVISIVVGSLSILASGLSAMYAAMFWLMATILPAMAASGAFPGQLPGGLMPAELTVISSTLQASQPLSGLQHSHLFAFLSEQGASIFDRTVTPVTPTAIRQMISASGSVPPAAPGETGTVFYMLPAGRLDIGEDFVAWYPTLTPSPGATSPSAGSSALSDTDANALTAAINRSANRGLSPNHIQILYRELTSPRQALVRPSKDLREMIDSIAGVPPSLTGGFIVNTTTGAVFYLPGAAANSPSSAAGGTVYYSARAYRTIPATTAPSTAPVASSAPIPQVGSMHIAALLAVIEGLASLGLGVFLLVIGILVFRFSRRGRWQHLMYAWIKIPLTIIGAAAWSWLAMEFMRIMFSGMPGGAGVPRNAAITPIAVAFIVGGLISIIYPVALLIALRSKTVRQYYETIGT
jgi:hypothetical protein